MRFNYYLFLHMKFHKILAFIGLMLWVSETVYFGFNDTPINGWEKILDFVSVIFIIWGVFGDVLSGITIVKKYENESTYNVQKGEFNFRDSRLTISDFDIKTKPNN